MLTLLWGLPEDGPLARVRRELVDLGAPFWLLSQRDVLETRVDLSVDQGRVEGTVSAGERILDVADVGAVYMRPHDTARLPRLSRLTADSAPRRHAAAVDEALDCWLGITSAYVVNLPSASAGNGSKPFQLRQIQQAGFAVPETVVTSDPMAARAFARLHGDVVYKSVSGTRSRVQRLRPADLARLDDLAACPTQLQRRIPGTDVRVHVVGAQLFATRIRCDADDYRYAVDQGHAPARLSGTELPPGVELRCRALSRRLGLPVAGIDLRVTPDGDWYCFEVNPSPAFTYYEHHTGQPIGRHIAALLAAAASARPPSSAGPVRLPAAER